MQDEQVRFTTLIEYVLNQAVQNYVEQSVSRDLMTTIRADIRGRLNEMFRKCNFSLSPESVNWLADEFFKCINFRTNEASETQTIGTKMVLFDQPDIKKLPIGDIEIMSNLFGMTDFGDDLIAEHRRRAK